MSTPIANNYSILQYNNETTVGQFEPMTTASYVVPATEVNVQLDRGTGYIPRQNIHTGLGGGSKGVVGSLGATLTFTSEMQYGSAALDKTTGLLLGCGMEVVSSGTNALIRPSDTTSYSDYAGTLPQDHGTISFLVADKDLVTYKLRGSVGQCSFNLQSGEIPTVSYTYHCLVEATSSFAESQSGFPTTGSLELDATPPTIKNMTITIDGETPVNLTNLTININQELIENADPTEVFGLGISTIRQGEYPTVTFEVAQDDTNKTDFWSKFINGTTFRIDVKFSGQKSFQFHMDNAQFAGPPSRNTGNNSMQYGLTCNLIQTDENNRNDFVIEYDFT